MFREPSDWCSRERNCQLIAKKFVEYVKNKDNWKNGLCVVPDKIMGNLTKPISYTDIEPYIPVQYRRSKENGIIY